MAASLTPQRTYWHLESLARRPSDYEIVSSRLLYSAQRGFEVRTPVAAFYERHQGDTPLRALDWELFRDPRELTYESYVATHAHGEAFVEGLFSSIDGTDYDRRLPREWVDFLDRVLGPLRYPVHGLQMVAAYTGQMAPGSRLAIASLFQVADEIRRIHALAYRTRQIQTTHPAFAKESRRTFESYPAWQPTRKVIERLLVTYDWGESLVATNLVVKPVFDEFFMVHLGRVARSVGDDILERLFFSLGEDCARHREWAAAAVLLSFTDFSSAREAAAQWIAKWRPLALGAIASLAELVEAVPRPRGAPASAAPHQRPAEMVAEIEASLSLHLQRLEL